MDLTEAEDIKRWQKYIELHKKDLHDPDNHDGVTHLETDILEHEVKWALGSITMNNVTFYLEKSSDRKAVVRSICEHKGEKFKNLCNN